MYYKYRITVVVLMVVQSSRMQRTRTIAAAIKKYLLRTSLLHSRYLFSASLFVSLSFSLSYSLVIIILACARVRSFVCLFIHSFIHSFVQSFIRPFILIHLLT